MTTINKYAEEKQNLVKELNLIIVEKNAAYKRIDAIINREYEINSRLGEIYEATRTE